MNFGSNNKTAQKYLDALNIFLLSAHALLLVVFAALEVYLMVFVNVGSILYYVIGIAVLKRRRTFAYICGTFCEIVVHMFLAVVSVGWGMGFQLYFIGCIPIVYYVDYFASRLGKPHIKGAVFCIVSAALYLVSFLVTHAMGPLYYVVDHMEFVGIILNSVAVFTFVTVLFGLLTKTAAYYEMELGRQATHDKLTGLVNRYFLMDQLEDIYEEMMMSSYWIAILDIDDFKKINDRYGHLCGDFVLKSLADILRKNCGSLTVCRWGGEEFVIVGSDGEDGNGKAGSGKSRNHGGRDHGGRDGDGDSVRDAGKGGDGKDGGKCGDRPQRNVLLDNIRRDVAIKDFLYDEKTVVHMTVTIGTARYREGQTLDEWINAADRRLYLGKTSGKNKVVDSE